MTSQLYITATVLSVDENQMCQILLAETFDREVKNQEMNRPAVLKAVELFESHQKQNPRPPSVDPHNFVLLGIRNFVVTPRFRGSGTFVRTDIFRAARNSNMPRLVHIWYCAENEGTGQAFLWQHHDEKWCMGPRMDHPVFMTIKPVTYAHEDHEWEVLHDGRPIHLKIFFMAETKETQQRASGTTASAGAAGGRGDGAAGGRVAGAADDAAASSNASSGTTASADTPSSGASAGRSAGSTRSSTASANSAASASATGVLDVSAADANHLKKGTVLSLSHGRNSSKEAWCAATIEALLPNDRVRYSCHKNRQGQLDDQPSGELSREQALLCLKACLTQRHISDPHQGSFSSFVVYHTNRELNNFTGAYTRTADYVGDRPVFAKVKVQHCFVTHVWCSPAEKKWIFGTASQMSDTPEQGYAVAKKSTKWPHYIHDYVNLGPTMKIFSYAIKDLAVVVEDSSDDDNTAGAHADAPAGRLSQKRNAEGELVR
jgi:hypothetical protein